MNKQEILEQALTARIAEVMQYQINIDNYTLALQRIDDLKDEELEEFKQRLTELLASEKLEQKKSQVILHVIKQQLET
jgi:ribosomal protein L14E/L6E/L27E